jgi:hypothetical protein
LFKPLGVKGEPTNTHSLKFLGNISSPAALNCGKVRAGACDCVGAEKTIRLSDPSKTLAAIAFLALIIADIGSTLYLI